MGFKVGYEEVYVGSLLEGLEGSAFVVVGSCGVFWGVDEVRSEDVGHQVMLLLVELESSFVISWA